MRAELKAAAGMMLLAVAVMGAGCAGVQVSSGTANYVYPSLSVAELQSAIYPCDQCAAGKVTLTGGKYSEPLTTSGTDLLTITLLGQWTVLGDIDGDGNKDAAAILTFQGRGNSVLYHLMAMINDNGKPDARADLVLGDRIKINQVTITNGNVLVDLNRKGPSDPVEDPRDRFRETYKFTGQDFTRVDQVEIPR